jgi:hypothetical protein
MFIPARMGVTTSQKEKVSLHGGSFGSQGGTLLCLLTVTHSTFTSKESPHLSTQPSNDDPSSHQEERHPR